MCYLLINEVIIFKMKIDKFVEIVDCGEEVDFDELMENLSQVDPELQKKPVRKILSDNFRVLYF